VHDLDQITHVIFDLDGVLLDTEPLYTEATQRIVAPFGKVFDWSTKRHMMGRDALYSARHLVSTLELPISPEEYLRQKDPLLLELFPDAKQIPGAPELVRSIKTKGLPCAVATSSIRAHFELKIQKHDWFSLFDALVYGDHPGVRAAKPAPDIFLVAADALGAEPENCLVFEDSLAGVSAAATAGMRVIAIPDPHLDAAEYCQAHRVIRSYAELEWA
jgi:pseudouridine-5'-monophosphatase